MLPGVDNRVADLRSLEACEEAVRGVAHVYNLACDMGGMGFIEANKAAVHDLRADQHAPADGRQGRRASSGTSTRRRRASTTSTSSSDSDVTALREEDAYPALPEDGYGWEKLFSERMCRNFHDDFGIETRVARYHNVYGPHGTYDGGREKAPAAICRKVAAAKLGGHERDRDLGRRRADAELHVHRRLPATARRGSWRATSVEPINLGSAELVTINQLVDIVEEIAGVRLKRRYNLDAPKGVRGRNSDNTLHPRAPRLGAEHAARRRAGEDVRVDLRRADGVAAPHPSSRRDRLMLEATPAITGRRP